EAFIILKSPSDIVLLDEPFKSLSPLACQKIKETIREEKLNKLIIGADHNYERWEDISDENYLLKNKGLKLLT
ncbi:MAG: ABC transporter ATP-binding protein, partial [Bacteroidota bacterium]